MDGKLVAVLDIVYCPVARNHPDPLLRGVRETSLPPGGSAVMTYDSLDELATEF